MIITKLAESVRYSRFRSACQPSLSPIRDNYTFNLHDESMASVRNRRYLAQLCPLRHNVLSGDIPDCVITAVLFVAIDKFRCRQNSPNSLNMGRRRVYIFVKSRNITLKSAAVTDCLSIKLNCDNILIYIAQACFPVCNFMSFAKTDIFQRIMPTIRSRKNTLDKLLYSICKLHIVFGY